MVLLTFSLMSVGSPEQGVGCEGRRYRCSVGGHENFYRISWRVGGSVLGLTPHMPQWCVDSIALHRVDAE